MLYYLVKIIVRLSLPLFTKKIIFYNKQALNIKPPFMVASNHPNSFLDALIIAAYLKSPVYFIARGDVFKNKIARFFLTALKMIPIFRIRDGKEKLQLNDETFEKSVHVLNNGGSFIIFVEGFCENQTSLQLPLKKGGPRVLVECWKNGNPVKVLPVWLEYRAFKTYGKQIEVRLGNVFSNEIAIHETDAQNIVTINKKTEAELQTLAGIQRTEFKQHKLLNIIMLPFAVLGALINAPFYLLAKAFAKSVSAGNPHYHSNLLTTLIFGYPLYVILVCYILYAISGYAILWVLILVMPLLARIYVLRRL
jgi:1-acyl-sn-glycerol-3-phosphate acyltransferase